MSEAVVLFPSDDEDTGDMESHEIRQYNNLKAMLKGVPPPSSITVSKFTVDEMLQKYRENEGTYGFGLSSANCIYMAKGDEPAPFLNYSNSSQLSEEVAMLLLKVQERYVQMETMSSCNQWFNSTIQSCGSAKKRARIRQGMGISPGRRLSHLARRRQFFSSANLQRLANTNSVRQIQIKKGDHKDERKKLIRTIAQDKLKSSKRALFLSPEEETPTKYGDRVGRKSFIPRSVNTLPLQESNKKIEVSKWLSQQDFDVDLPRKRPREECTGHSVERKRKCPRRSLNFGDEEVIKSHCPDTDPTMDKKTPATMGKLSQNHKNKLLWAVSVILKENNISRNDDRFKPCAQSLFQKCRKNLDEILSLQTGTGTSDKILHYARQHIESIFDELEIRRDDPPKEQISAKVEFKENVGVKEKGQGESTAGEKNSDFSFKTPSKRPPRRKVKSCQKSFQAGNKTIRRWRSFESLLEITDTKHFDPNCTDSVAPNSGCVSYLNNFSEFSPVPSSVKDDFRSPEVSYPALCKKADEEDWEISNQDEELRAKLLSFGETCNGKRKSWDIDVTLGSKTEDTLEEATVHGAGDEETTVKAAEETIERKLKEEREVPVESEKMIEATEKETTIEEHPKEAIEITKEKTPEDTLKEEKVVKSEGEESLADAGKNVSDGKYKPRKLVVKKSKPNWKVVRQNSEEEKNDSDLRLKMRLSHEWEVVCRNSSSSDVGASSEYYSSSTCDERDYNTDADGRDSAESLNSPILMACKKNFKEQVNKNHVVEEPVQLSYEDSCDENSACEPPENACSSPVLFGRYENSGETPAEPRKKLLSLENYKARRMMEAKKFEEEPSQTKKKFYNIRLKHPIGRRKHKRKDKRKKTEDREEAVETDRNIINSTDSVSDVSDIGVKTEEVSIQTIVSALSTLSNLVEHQIRLENEKTKCQTDGDRTVWLNMISSWCCKNLNSLKTVSNGDSMQPTGSENIHVAVPSTSGVQTSDSVEASTTPVRYNPNEEPSSTQLINIPPQKSLLYQPVQYGYGWQYPPSFNGWIYQPEGYQTPNYIPMPNLTYYYNNF